MKKVLGIILISITTIAVSAGPLEDMIALWRLKKVSEAAINIRADMQEVANVLSNKLVKIDAAKSKTSFAGLSPAVKQEMLAIYNIFVAANDALTSHSEFLFGDITN